MGGRRTGVKMGKKKRRRERNERADEKEMKTFGAILATTLLTSGLISLHDIL